MIFWNRYVTKSCNTVGIDANSQSSRHKHGLNNLRMICPFASKKSINMLNPKISILINIWGQRDRMTTGSWNCLDRIPPAFLKLPSVIQCFLLLLSVLIFLISASLLIWEYFSVFQVPEDYLNQNQYMSYLSRRVQGRLGWSIIQHRKFNNREVGVIFREITQCIQK